MDLRQRVLEYCKRKNIAVSRFEKECNLANGYFNQVKKRPSLDKIESISRAFPDLNTDWLLTGEGEMLRQNIQQAGDNATQVQGTNNHVSSPRVLLNILDRWEGALLRLRESGNVGGITTAVQLRDVLLGMAEGKEAKGDPGNLFLARFTAYTESRTAPGTKRIYKETIRRLR